jgi:hypothetical protein
MSEPTFTHDVFLSHSAKDKAVGRPLAERLRTGRAEAAGRRRKEGLNLRVSGILHSAFILLPLPNTPIKGSLTQFLYTNWCPTIP